MAGKKSTKKEKPVAAPASQEVATKDTHHEQAMAGVHRKGAHQRKKGSK